MPEGIYTLGVWKVNPGKEGAFVEAWKALGQLFAELPRPPAEKGVLIQSVSDSSLFYSFGPWHSLEDIQAMRGNASAQEGIRRLVGLCAEATPGAFRVVAESDPPRKR